MADLIFGCTGASADRYAATPTLSFQLTITERSGVRVHAILTGPTDTEMTRALDIPKADLSALTGRAEYADFGPQFGKGLWISVAGRPLRALRPLVR